MSRLQAIVWTATSDAASAPHRRMRQRPELYVLCVIEGCERFAATSLSSLLVLYLTEQRGASVADALQLVGAFNALCYLTPLAGGLLSDLFGRWRAMLSGAMCMAAAYGVLWTASPSSLPMVLILLIAGHGLFKPSINALLSNLYDATDHRRETAHSWFYLAANLGSMFAPLIAGVLHARSGWKLVFLVAASSMTLGVLAAVGWRVLRSGAPRLVFDARTPSTRRVTETAWPVQRGVFLALGLTVLSSAAAFGQCDGVLLLWARDDVQRTVLGHQIPVSWFAALPALLVLVLGPLLTLVDDRALHGGRAMSASKKILAGLGCISSAFVLLAVAAWRPRPGEMTSAAWMVAAYLLLTLGELLVIPLSQALLTQFVPPRRAGLASGLWFAALAGGYWLAGLLGAYWSTISHDSFFLVIAILVSAAGLAGRSYYLSLNSSAAASPSPAPAIR